MGDAPSNTLDNEKKPGARTSLPVAALTSLGPTSGFEEGGFRHSQRRAYPVAEVSVIRMGVQTRRPEPVLGCPDPLRGFHEVVHSLVEYGFFVGHAPLLL